MEDNGNRHEKLNWKDLLVISIVFAIINLFLFSHTGIKIVSDSPRYLEYAENLKHGFYFDSHNFWYLGYVLFIAVVNIFFHGAASIVAFQVVLSFFAVTLLFRASLELWGNKNSAYCTIGLYLLFFEISAWNFYILAESLYLSCVCITLWPLIRWLKNINNWKGGIAFVVMALFTATIKPTGIALLAAGIGVIIHLIWQSGTSRFLKRSVVLCATVLIVVLANRMLTTFLIMENYQLGEIIYATRGVTGYNGIHWLTIDPPTNLYIPATEWPPILRIVLFILHNPVYWTKLFLAKIFFLLAHIRPYWSMGHNIFVAVTVFPAYIIAFAGFRRIGNRGIKVFFLVFLLIQVLAVGVTSEDWDGRFLMPLLPVIFLLAGGPPGGLIDLRLKIKHPQNKN